MLDPTEDLLAKSYIQRPVTRAELESLVALATAEERAFFSRNPHLIPTYRDRLIAVALCQGAALQFLGRGYGVADFDVHFFYAQNPAKPRLSRAIKPMVATVGTFHAATVDFIRTVVPGEKPPPREDAVVEHLRSFLHSKPTARAGYLAQKAVVGLLPDELFGMAVWPLV